MSWDFATDGGTRALAQIGLFCGGRTKVRLTLPRQDAPGIHVRHFRLSGKAI
jgi:hypothetical protein